MRYRAANSPRFKQIRYKPQDFLLNSIRLEFLDKGAANLLVTLVYSSVITVFEFSTIKDIIRLFRFSVKLDFSKEPCVL